MKSFTCSLVIFCLTGFLFSVYGQQSNSNIQNTDTDFISNNNNNQNSNKGSNLRSTKNENTNKKSSNNEFSPNNSKNQMTSTNKESSNNQFSSNNSKNQMKDSTSQNEQPWQKYRQCLLNKEKCTPEGEKYKSNLIDILKDGCAKCNEEQKGSSQQTFTTLYEKERNFYNQLIALYDPEKNAEKHLIDLKVAVL